MMTVSKELERLLITFRRYYDININGEGSFCATATFHSNDSHYFLTKRALIGEAESHEYVYFSTAETLDLEQTKALIEEAWNIGLSHVRPTENHRSSDVILIILAENITEAAKKYVRQCKLFKSYDFTFKGWSAFKLVAVDTSTGEIITNRRGKDLKKLFRQSRRRL